MYEDSKEEKVQKKEYLQSLPSKLQSSMTIMPAMWVEQLYNTALQCNERLIFELLTQISQENSSLAVTLTNLTENFQFDQITILIQQVRIEPCVQ